MLRFLLLATASALALLQAVAALAQDQTQTRTGETGEPMTVIVTASPIAGHRDRFATIVGTVDRDAILQSGGANIADALANVPGVTGTSFASGASRPVIRGFDSNRVRMLEDGIGSFDVSEVGPDHGVPIDPLAAQSIEVVRGAATLRYGSQAIGGVVNVINNRVPTSLPDTPLTGEIGGTYATNAETREGSALIDGRIGRLALHADGFARKTADYDTPLGEMANSFFEGHGYSAGGSYFFGEDTRLGGAYTHYDAQYGIPAEDAFIDMEQSKALFRSSFEIAAGALQTLSIDAGYGDYTHSEIDPAGPSIESTFNDTEWDARAEAVFGTTGPLSASALGVQFQDRDFSALGAGADFLLPATARSAAAFGFAEAPIGSKLHLQLGARIENVKTEGTPVSGISTARDFNPLSGSAGILFDVSNALKLGLAISSAARAPGIVELYSRGPHDGPRTFETGDPALDLERSNSVEASLRVRLPRADVEAAVWGAQIEDYIFGDLTGNLCDDIGDCTSPPGAGLKELFYQQQDAHFWGAEAKAAFVLAEIAGGTLDADFLADFVRAKFDGGANVPRIPPYHAGSGLSWSNEDFDAGFMLSYAGQQDDTAAAETSTKSYLSLNAHVVWQLLKSPGLELSVSGRNLTGDVQRNHVSFNKDDVVLPGRDVRIVLRATF